jgi:O-antigen/teichoic acid export membrane protein
MNYKLQEFAKDSLFYAVGQWMGKLGGLILVPILSRIFLPGDYGVIDLLNTSYQFTLMVISLNIDSGVQKFYFLRNEDDRKVLLSSTMAFRFCLSCLAAILAVACSGQLSRLVFHGTSYAVEICLLAAVLPFEDMNSQLMLLLRLNRKALSFSVYNVCQVVVQPVLTYLCVVTLGQGMKGVFIARLMTVLIITTPLLLHQRKFYAREVRLREAFGVMKFSLPGLPAILQGNTMSLLPRYILAYYSGLTVVGLYGIADKMANTIEMFKSSFNRAWNPFAFANAGQADEKYLYEKVFRYFSFFLLLLITSLTFFAREILWLLTPPKYYSAAALVGGICVYYAVRALTLIFSTGLYSANKVAHTSLMAMIQLAVFLAAASVLVPKYNAAGLVFSLDAAAAAYFFSYGLTVKKFFPFRFSSGRLIAAFVLALCGGVYAGGFSGISGNTVSIGIIFQKSALWCLYALLSYYIILTGSERNEIEKRVKSLFALLCEKQ